METQTKIKSKLWIGIDFHKKTWRIHFLSDTFSGNPFSHAGKNSKAVIFKVGRKLLSKVMAVIKTEIPYSIGVLN